jgi:NitT/TauT family transport system substrate-binding protein
VVAQEKVVFAINWKAESSQGGFYQALVDGTYKRYGLDVEIRQGGPQVNNRPLLSAGRIDFLLTGNLLHSFDNVRNKVPTIVVASMFQKDPQALITHPGQYATWDDMKKAPVIFIAKDAQYTWWQWMKSQGFNDSQLKPYAYNSSAFLANKRSVQQGYITAEPIAAPTAGACALRNICSCRRRFRGRGLRRLAASSCDGRAAGRRRAFGLRLEAKVASRRARSRPRSRPARADVASTKVSRHEAA